MLSQVEKTCKIRSTDISHRKNFADNRRYCWYPQKTFQGIRKIIRRILKLFFRIRTKSGGHPQDFKGAHYSHFLF